MTLSIAYYKLEQKSHDVANVESNTFNGIPKGCQAYSICLTPFRVFLKSFTLRSEGVLASLQSNNYISLRSSQLCEIYQKGSLI